MGCSMKAMDDHRRASAGVARMPATSSATPSAEAYCSLPSSEAK
jgi:hypothetical protein